MLTLFVPVIEDEIDNFAILLMSLKHFMNPHEIKVLILTPSYSKGHIIKIIEKMDRPNVEILFLADEEIYPYDRKNTSGWIRQQIFKLLIANFIDTDFYLIFDCDVFAIRQFSINDIIRGGKGIMELQSSPGDFQDLEMVSDILGIEYSGRNMEVMKVTPAVFSTKVVRNMLQHISSKKCDGDISKLPSFLYDQMTKQKDNSSITEYMLYYVYARHKNELQKKHFRGTIFSEHCVWKISDVLDWDPSDVFSGNGFFCVYQGNTKIPSDIIFDQIRDYIGFFRDKKVPKISCLMVTKGEISFVKRTVRCFLKQTYPNKELIIVSDKSKDVELYINSLNLSYVFLYQYSPKEKTLGELRNISIGKANGDLVAQWDDDDWYHPSRLSIQYKFLKEKNVDACLLSKWLMCWPSEKKYSISNERKEGWEGTILAKKSLIPKYPSIKKFEDTEMMRELSQKSKIYVITEDSYYFLYIYLIHGNNTWDKDHFSIMFRNGRTIEKNWRKDAHDLAKKMAVVLEMPYSGYDSSEEEPNPYFLFLLILISLICLYFLFR